MAIVSFWSQNERESGQTLSIVATTTYMAIEHNYKILLVDACFGDDTIENCFSDASKNNMMAKKLNQGKVDIASGVEGVISAIVSNKTSPEIITNFTRPVLKNRLDILLRQKTTDRKEFENNLLMYPEILRLAAKYYDLVFVDLGKGLSSEGVKKVLETSDVIVVTMSQRMKNIDDFTTLSENPIFSKRNVIPLIGRYDKNSKYNAKNIARYIGQKKEICAIPYNTLLFESADEHTVANYFLKVRTSGETDRNSEFVKNIKNADETIIYRLQELQMNM